MDNKPRFSSEEDALKVVITESFKECEEMDMNLIMEGLYYLCPKNEAEDRAFIERTLPILQKKLGFESPEDLIRKERGRRYLLISVSAIITALFVAIFLLWCK